MILCCLKAFLFLESDWRLPFLNYVDSQLWRLYFDFPSSFFLCLTPSMSLFVPSDSFAASWTSCSVCTVSNIYMEYEGGWHAKQPNAMWKACGASTECIRCRQAGSDTQWYHSTEDANLLCTSLPTCLFSILLHYYSHSKEPYSKLHPIWADVSTFILAEFNYCFPFFAFLSHSFIQNLEAAFIIFNNNVPIS